MPIISNVGRKAWSVRIITALLYFVLTTGGVTMLYPFLLMIATSMTDQVDYNEYRLIPRYFTQDEARFQKFIAEKYARAKRYSELHTHEYQTFRQIGLPTFEDDPEPTTAPRVDPQTGQPAPDRVVIDGNHEQIERRVALWREFQTSLEPLAFGVWYVGGSNIPGKAEIHWRELLSERYDGDLDAMNDDLGKDVGAFTECFAPYENPDGRLWPGVAGGEGALWHTFKTALDPRYRRPVDATIIWQRYLRYKYEKIDILNQTHATAYKDFREALMPTTLPENENVAKDWEYVVRGKLPYRFVKIAGDDAKYRAYLAGDLGDLVEINRQLGTSYATTDDIHWPPGRTTKRELDAVSAFLHLGLDLNDVTVDTPDKRYVSFLRDRFHTETALNAALGTSYASFNDVRPPYEEEDLWEFRRDSDEWMGWFLTRNYGEVIDYIAIRGRALWNTLILLAAMIFCALTVNPLAAYALSRFRLGYTNSVLLFVLATMAFPYEVAMIPNFLLLRRFPLWTWLVGLVVGGVVALVVLRRMKGQRKWIAAPVGLGAAVLAGFYLTPLIGRHLFGVEEIGSVSLLNTFPALILPRMANGYAIFLLKGFFDSLPEELFEAGKIDGASELRMFWQVAFPLSKPIFAVMALQTFTAIYGSYIWALVVCQSDKMWTLMVYIFQLQQFAPQHVTMAATVLASIPTLLVFIFAQKTIMRGIIIPAYK